MAFLAAFGLFLRHAFSVLPLQDWPLLSPDPIGMTTNQVILVYAVLPRAAVAFLAGAALSLAGVLFQRLLRNPIAEPSTLGVSAGAQLAIVAATLFFPDVLDGHRVIVALIGTGGATALVFLLGWRRNFDPITMVVSGLLVGVTCNAVSAALTLSQGEYLMSLVSWNGGSLAQQDWSVAITLGVVLFIGIALSLLLLRPLALLNLGDGGAKSLGLSLTAIRLTIASIAVGLTAAVAAYVGLIGFVGLGGPAIARGFGARRPASILLASPLAGGLLLWLCDGFVQLASSSLSESFPTGAVTALIGGPLLLYLLPKVRPVEVVVEHHVAPGARAGLKTILAIALVIGAALFVAFVLARAESGWVTLSPAEIADLFPMRWPRILAASAAGALLAMAGAVLQRLTGNAMASPEVLGVSGGAGVGFAIVITVFPAADAFGFMVGAAIGAIAVMAVVLLFASRRSMASERLLLAGIAVSSLTSAVLGALLAIGDQRSWQILSWLSGSGVMATSQTAGILVICAIAVLAAGLVVGRWLSIMPLGDTVPFSLGVPVRAARVSLICLAGLATGVASLLVGPLSFVGLMAPHIALRMGFVRASQQFMASAFLGAVLMVIADVGARTVTFPYEQPLGLFAALIGAPYLVWLIGRRH